MRGRQRVGSAGFGDRLSRFRGRFGRRRHVRPKAQIRGGAFGNSPENRRGRFEVFDSSLSEAGVLGFEYGYSVVAADALVMWEAQFGDFNNVAQSIVDQYVAAGEDKWKQTSRLTLLLPHGYEGQGPEHSSARLERYLQLCAENNLCVCYPTTPAQYFHLLRRQVTAGFERPLIIMTPKSLLRLPAAASSLDQLTSGGFQPIIDDNEQRDPARVERIVLCSGKVFYDLKEARSSVTEPRAIATGPPILKIDRVAIIRLEQFYPFPLRALTDTIARYSHANELVWCQEEPKNMGAWTFMESRLENLLSRCERPRYVGRDASASPATGSYAVHLQEQERLVKAAVTVD